MASGSDIVRCSAAALMGAPEFPALIAEYAAESAIDGMPSPEAKLATYALLEATGMLHVYAALQEGQVIGFITVLAPVLPHYSAVVAVTESFFVAAAHRKSGAGLRLLKAAEDCARFVGSPGLLVSAPAGGRLAEVLSRRGGYRESSRVFFKRSTDA